MSNKGNPDALRGPGEERFNRLIRQRPPKKLESGEHMLYEHALRCFCKACGSLLNWECPQDISYTETECCGFLYRLQPWTVKVRIEDVSARPILPKMEGSNYSDPAFRFSDDLIVGDVTTIKTTTGARLSSAQQSLGKTVLPPGVRRCGICRTPGHTRRACPEAEAE